ncbi:hypothetical protein M0R45_023091 [Rubus argutus]|uniref:Wax synthase domain-containing protein n=1 Tax=Rubus argutus TaxID=59490 RepID=A0AAW1WQA2_RUBAR
MPGPGAHFFYAMSSGLALNSLSKNQFGAHHVLFYTMHVLSSSLFKLYSQASLTIIQCFLLGSAGGLSHFFLDYLFEVNTQLQGDISKQVYLDSILVVLGLLALLFFFFFYIYRFQTETPQASVQKSPPPQRSLFAALQSLFVGALRLLPFRMPTLETSAQRTSLPRTILASIIAWFRSNVPELWCLKGFLVRSVRLASFKMAVVLFLVASGYVKWLEFYKTSWKRPGIGEEADVGVIIFMAKYFVLPHLLCLLSMHRDQ